MSARVGPKVTASRRRSPWTRLREALRGLSADGFAAVLQPGTGAPLREAWSACVESMSPELRGAIDTAAIAAALADWDPRGRQDRAQLVAQLMRLALQHGDAAVAPSRPRRAAPVAAPVDAPAVTDARARAIDTLPGVGPATAAKLRARGIGTLEDLAMTLPTGYLDLRRTVPPSQWQDGELVTFLARVRGLRQGFARGRFGATMELEIDPGGERVQARWFSPTGGLAQWAKLECVRVVGVARQVQGRWSLPHPQLRDPAQPLPGIAVRYPAVEGVPAASFAKLVRAALLQLREGGVDDPLPESLRERFGLPELLAAWTALHEPDAGLDDDALAALRSGASIAHRRLAFEELFYVQLSLGLERARFRDAPTAVTVAPGPALARRWTAALPFAPTGAQTRVLDEILADMAGARPMLRLVQGDVGSGKTAVAFGAALAVAAAGGQCAIMAPTEILAEQHARTLAPWCERAGLRLGLVTGASKGGARESLVALTAAGSVDVMVGTHALLTSDVGFARLGLVVIDEQHRFGVEQRAQLRAKGERPHLLVMTATPIPRSLALVAYGELDVSVIDELPPGRSPPTTAVLLGPRALASARARLVARVRAGEQAFVVCPLVEASESLDVSDVEAAAAALRSALPDHAVGVVHGRMSSREKDTVMREFQAGTIAVLVATTVIEVGVDVPRASASWSSTPSASAWRSCTSCAAASVAADKRRGACCTARPRRARRVAARLSVLERHADGFAVAEADLELRGPGEVFGTRQAGAHRLRTPLRGHALSQLLLDARDAAAAAIAQGDPQRAPWAAELRRRVGAGVFGEA
ncbi:MAG: ATP-dependent DNA helicase RecG [Nannocystaceae bacterium]